jgi:hypothetical protein
MRMALRAIRERLNSMQPGPLRRELEADVEVLKVRLLEMPARVAEHAPFPDREEINTVLTREMYHAFGNILTKWGI